MTVARQRKPRSCGTFAFGAPRRGPGWTHMGMIGPRVAPSPRGSRFKAFPPFSRLARGAERVPRTYFESHHGGSANGRAVVRRQRAEQGKNERDSGAAKGRCGKRRRWSEFPLHRRLQKQALAGAGESRVANGGASRFTRMSVASMFTRLSSARHRVLHGLVPIWPARPSRAALALTTPY